MLSEFIQRNPNYNNIKRNNFITHNYLKRHIIQSKKKNNVNETYVYNINEYDIFIKRDNKYRGIAC